MEQKDQVRQAYLRYGGPHHEPLAYQTLKAGSLDCRYEAGNLRYISVGGTELVRMIYSAVRDENWGTVSPEVLDEEIKVEKDHFLISYRTRYVSGDIQFEASYQILGTQAGRIDFSMEGRTLSAFKKNRIGFNVLHPPEVAGVACKVEHTSGDEEQGKFPEQISPHQPFKDIKAIHWKLSEATARLSCEGDIFEMEDQRNWTDASFKTYSTPLELPFPVKLEAGETIRQKVSLQLQGVDEKVEQPATSIKVKLTEERLPVPKIGIGQSSEVETLGDIDLAFLRALSFSHYRVDLRLDAENKLTHWRRACRESRQLQLPLELAIHFGRKVAGELSMLQDLLDADQAEVKQILIFSRDEKTTPEWLKESAISDLRTMFPKALIGGGTDCFFTELNRERVSPEKLDFLTYSLNPQVHHSDHQSMIETLSAQTFTVESAQSFSGGSPVYISPISLKMRFNPNATSTEAPTPKGQLPPQVDTRQQSIFAAAWTMGSIKYLAESKAASITYFETTGRRGVLPGSQATDRLNLSEKPYYPMYWVFYQLLRNYHKVRKAESSHPLQLEVLAGEQKDGTVFMMLANFHEESAVVELEKPDQNWESMILDEDHFYQLPDLADNWQRQHWQKVEIPLKVNPFSVYFLRQSETQSTGS